MDIVYLDFRKVFDAVCSKILVDELLVYGRDEQMGRGG